MRDGVYGDQCGGLLAGNKLLGSSSGQLYVCLCERHGDSNAGADVCGGRIEYFVDDCARGGDGQYSAHFGDAFEWVYWDSEPELLDFSRRREPPRNLQFVANLGDNFRDYSADLDADDSDYGGVGGREPNGEAAMACGWNDAGAGDADWSAT